MSLVAHLVRHARALFALLVIVLASTAGCVAHPPPARVAEAPAPLLTAPGAEPQQAGLTPVGRREARAVLYAAVAVVIVGAFLVDLALLPFRHHRPFACCETVIYWCH
ncbi:MAG: hypothetical protein M9894_02030 [Planctomycetes bacterium]|nr:hypothetical protein [Planctomycetota bacterium]